MKTPSLFTRLLGNPVAVLCTVAWLLHALAYWCLGQPSWAEIIFAGCFTVRSLRSWRAMRTHKAWMRQWNDTGQMEEGKAARISADGSRSRRKSVTRILVPGLCLMFLVIAANNAPPGDLPVVGLLSLGCAVWLIVVILAQKLWKHGGGQQTTVVKTDAPSMVSWVNGPAISAPSRTFATSNLPDYALAVMGLRRVNQ